MEYKIGDIVTIKQQESLVARRNGDPTAWTKRKGDTSGKRAEICDKLYSEANDKYLYRIRLEDEDFIRSAYYTEEDFVTARDIEDDYTIDYWFEDNVISVVIYKGEGSDKTEVTRGHGHIIHEGDKGILQAFSYAFKKAYEKINGGKI